MRGDDEAAVVCLMVDELIRKSRSPTGPEPKFNTSEKNAVNRDRRVSDYVVLITK